MASSTPTRAKMTTPSTPSRVKVSTEPSKGARTPSCRANGAANATASPQVKAALAAMRKAMLDELKKKQLEQQHSTSSLAIELPLRDVSNSAEEISEDVFSAGENGSANQRGSQAAEQDSRPSGSTLGADEGQDLVQWGGKSTSKLINEAKRTGRLNLSARSLTRVPQQVYTALLHSSSEWYPQTAEHDSPSAAASRVDLTFGRTNQDSDAVAWYEQTELTSLSLANNEIDQLEETIAGFESLQTLDIHNNLLTSLPTPMIHLGALTTLNLASNKLTEFPALLTQLASIRELDLSSNKLRTLWASDWKARLKSTIRDGARSRPGTPTRDGGNAFYESFPSSPVKKSSRPSEPSLTLPDDSAPWPNLVTLKLNNNPLERDLLARDEFKFPHGLRTLDLSACYFDESKIPFKVFARLQHLRTLRMTDCGFRIGLGAQDVQDKDVLSNVQELDLTRNEFNSLEFVDSLFGPNRRINFVGLDKTVDKLVKGKHRLMLAHKTGRQFEEVDSDEEDDDETGEIVEVIVWGNPLKDEQARRRREWAELQDSLEGRSARSSAVQSPARDGSVEALAKDLRRTSLRSPVHQQPEATDLLQESEQTQVDDAVSEATADDEAVILISSAFVPSTHLVNLSTNNLDMLPVPTTGRAPDHLGSVRSLNLSRNAFTFVPLSAIVSWTWHSCLTHLDLSRNKLATTHLLSTFDETSVLNKLTQLDLSWNNLTSFAEDDNGSTSIFDLVSRFAPSVRHLDLSYNKLTSLSGVSNQIVVESVGEGRAASIETLSLRGNKIADIDELCQIGETVERHILEKGQAWVRDHWSLKVLDLGDNDIARLPPTLGLLPHSLILHLTGNKFRIPRREVYDNPSDKLVLPWLKERL
ncbi:hypothetical protein ACM66B_004030 [Microbotryomycetes sp. NB124-2]